MTEPTQPAATTPHEPTAEDWAAAYFLTFTPLELRVLEPVDPGDMSPLEVQYARMLRLALRPEQCPACKFVLCARSAWTGEHFDPRRCGDGPGYACTMCHAELEHWTDGLGEHGMALVPGQDVPTYGPGAM